MGEIRFVGTGETRGYPYLVCKKFKAHIPPLLKTFSGSNFAIFCLAVSPVGSTFKGKNTWLQTNSFFLREDLILEGCCCCCCFTFTVNIYGHVETVI